MSENTDYPGVFFHKILIFRTAAGLVKRILDCRDILNLFFFFFNFIFAICFDH